MRTLLAIAALLCAPFAAYAQESAPQTEAWGSGLADCLAKAADDADLTDHEAQLLCQGARSDAPVRCFEETEARTDMEEWQIITACSPGMGARGVGF